MLWQTSSGKLMKGGSTCIQLYLLCWYLKARTTNGTAIKKRVPNIGFMWVPGILMISSWCCDIYFFGATPPRNKALLRDDKQPLSLNKAFFGPYVLGGGPLRFPWKFGWMAPHLIFQNLNQTKYRAWGRPLNTTLRQDKWHLLNNNLWISWVGSQRKNKSTLTKTQKKKTERC